MQMAITGARGLLGSAVVEAALRAGHDVVALDFRGEEESPSPRLRYTRLDVTCYEAVEEALKGCDGVVHLAAHTSPHRWPAHQVHNDNVVGSYNVLSAAATLGIKKVCQASSVNAIGGVYSRAPRYDYFPIDEAHPTYNEDPYSLSKWVCEAQADSVARANPSMTVASLRLHALLPARAPFQSASEDVKDLWGYTLLSSGANACLLALDADYLGHEVFYIVASDTLAEFPSAQLRTTYYPDVPLRRPLEGRAGFFDTTKAQTLLSWQDV